MSFAQCSGQSLHVHHSAAGSIDENGSRLHARESASVNHIASFFSEWGVQRDDVTLGEERIQIHHLHTEHFFKARAKVRIASDNAHFESFSAKCSCAADPAKADNAHGHF